MEGGDLGLSDKPLYLVVFEGILGHLHRGAAYRALLRHAENTEQKADKALEKGSRARQDHLITRALHLWSLAAGCWAWDMRNLNIWGRAVEAYGETADFGIVTWQPPAMAFALETKLEQHHGGRVGQISVASYAPDELGQIMHQNPRIRALYDADPSHAELSERVRLVDPDNWVVS